MSVNSSVPSHPSSPSQVSASDNAHEAGSNAVAAPPSSGAPVNDSSQESPSGKKTKAKEKVPGFHLPKDEASAYENRLRALLGLLPKGMKLPHKTRLWGWVATLIAGVLAAFTRLINLSSPHAIIFDETYYVKGAFSLLTKGYEGTWNGDKANDLFLQGDYSALQDTASYVVHPPLGKWIMAVGQALFGTDNGTGWRFSTAIIGVFAVVLVVRIALRLFRSPWLAAFAGIAMALDGMGIVLSRTGILDNILAFFVLLGFWAVLVDRDHSRARLASSVAHGKLRSTDPQSRLPYSPEDPWGPRLLWRPWLLVAGLALGAACAVKWSGIYAVAVFGILIYVWGTQARRIVGARLALGAGVFREGVPAFFALVPTAFITYLAGWFSWFRNPHSYFRNWAQGIVPSELPLPWAPDSINSLIHYHQEMWNFHHGLAEPHTYQSQMWQWLVQGRPVSFFWRGSGEAPSTCGSTECVQAITSIGNIAVWWLALLALIAVVYAAIRLRDWRAWAILSGYAALWLPWLSYTNRTIFQFYAVAFLPFVVLALTYALALIGQILGRASACQQPFSRMNIRAFLRTHPGITDESGPSASVDPSAASEKASDKPDSSEEVTSKAEGFRQKIRLLFTSYFTDDGATSAQLSESEKSASAQHDDGAFSNASDISTECSSRENEKESDELSKDLKIPSPQVSSDTEERTTGEEYEDNWWEVPSSKSGYILLGGVTLLIAGVAAFWYPLWTGRTVSYSFWHLHMWFSSWI